MQFRSDVHFISFRDISCNFIKSAHKQRTKSRFGVTSTILAHTESEHNQTARISQIPFFPKLYPKIDEAHSSKGLKTFDDWAVKSNFVCTDSISRSICLIKRGNVQQGIERVVYFQLTGLFDLK